MRVVVIGPYPPSADPAAEAVLAEVRQLRSGTAVVDVVSPAPSAAGATGDPSTWTGAWRVARRVRSADRVIWFAPSGVRPALPLRRCLAAVPVLERRVVPHPPDQERRNVAGRLRRVRAGAPTLVRSLVARMR